jgi:hypothetical protein
MGPTIQLNVPWETNDHTSGALHVEMPTDGMPLCSQRILD